MIGRGDAPPFIFASGGALGAFHFAQIVRNCNRRRLAAF
jgi:hypothetical protein